MVGGAVNAALANFSKALAGQGLMDDVNVNWVSPGQTETDRLQQLLAARAEHENKTIDEVRAERMSGEGVRRLGQARRHGCACCVSMQRRGAAHPRDRHQRGWRCNKGMFLMDLSLTEEQHLLVSTIRAFVRDELKPLEVQVERDGKLDDSIADDLRRKSRALGLYAVNIPAEYGGGGLSVLDWMIAEEQFGWTSDILIRRAFGNVYEILLAGTAQQQEDYLLPAGAW
jgi:hypothetical protein